MSQDLTLAAQVFSVGVNLILLDGESCMTPEGLEFVPWPVHLTLTVSLSIQV